MIKLEVNPSGLEPAIYELNATEAQAEKALTSTLMKMSKWLRTRSAQGLSKELAVTQKVLRRRLKTMRLSKSIDGPSITVWYGLDPISVIYLGARKTKAGISAGKHRFPGAFISAGKNGKKQVFKRRGKSRLPIEKQVLDIQDRANVFIEDKLVGAAEFESQFLKTFEHELKWRTRK